MTENKPKFEHHCPNCIFLGHFQGADLYYCPGLVNEESLLYRDGDGAGDEVDLVLDQTEYPIDERLFKAFELAVDQGWLIDPADKFDSIPEKRRFDGWQEV
jgi:hypothetical protein